MTQEEQKWNIAMKIRVLVRVDSHQQQQNKILLAIHIFKYYDFFHIQKALKSFAALFRHTLPIAHM